MKTLLLLPIILLLSIRSNGQIYSPYGFPLMNNSVPLVTYLLSYKNVYGTCFSVNIKGRHYLITAKHIFYDKPKNQSIIRASLYKSTGSVPFNAQILFSNKKNIDIAVLYVGPSRSNENSFTISTIGTSYSQKCYFLGFPYGLRMDDLPDNIHNGFPYPLIKVGIISGINPQHGNGTIFYIDALNNPGFSGAPVVILNASDKSKITWQIIGVMSAYRQQRNTLQVNKDTIPYMENSGIAIAYGVNHIFKIIKQNTTTDTVTHPINTQSP